MSTQSSQSLIEVLQLLVELERRVHADATLEAEWQEALTNAPITGTRADQAARFREWFILERTSELLGAAPLLAWAPDAPEPDSAWARLLDNFLGIFRVVGERRAEGRSFVDLEDLWSGRSSHLPREAIGGDEVELPDGMLIVGRLVSTDDEVHLPLPGARIMDFPGIADAVERDLALARHQNPRARISQAECERLFAGLQAVPEPAQREEPQQDLIEELEQVLAQDPRWDMSRIQDSLNAAGVAQTLDQLAFESELDLEALRRILPALASQAQAVASEETSTTPEIAADPDSDAVSPEQAAAALEAYDSARAAGKTVGDAFAVLEEQLGLESGLSEEVLPSDDPSEAPVVGPDAVSGLSMWVESYLWENSGDRASEPELLRFAAATEALVGKACDAQELHEALVLPYLLTATGGEQLRDRRDQLNGFLLWAAQEQDAPLTAALDDWANAEDERLPAIAEANRVLRAVSSDWSDRQAVVSVQPVEVAAENEENARVQGLPDVIQPHLRIGDWVLGSWRDGAFVAQAVVPAAAIAQGAVESDS